MMENQDELKKRKKGYYWSIAIVLIIFAVLSAICVTIVLQSNNNTNENTNNNTNNNTNENTNNNTNNNTNTTGQTEIDMTTCSNTEATCTRYLMLQSKEIEVKTVTDYQEQEPVQSFYIDGKNIMKDEIVGCGGVMNVYALQDMIIVATHYGCDVLGTEIKAYTDTGIEKLWVQNIDSRYPGMSITAYEVLNNAIQVKGSRTIHGILDRSTEFCEAKIGDPNLSTNDIISGTYQIEYLGNGEFKEPKLLLGAQTGADLEKIKLEYGC